MDFDKMMGREDVEFGDMLPGPFLLGLLSAFENRYQASADRYFKEMTWKQMFLVICINLCKEPPTLKELSEVVGTSHQNVKQLVLKLEKKNFVKIVPDEKDKRKQRIYVTKECEAYYMQHEGETQRVIEKIFEEISQEELMITIKTIMQMERNLREL